jgi:hypothetical protein
LNPKYPGESSLGLHQFWRIFESVDGLVDDAAKYSAESTRLGRLLKDKGYGKANLRYNDRDKVNVLLEKNQ